MRLPLIALFCLAILGADVTGPLASPLVNSSTPIETITGSERLGWDQPATDAGELASIRYIVYVDGIRSDLAPVSCGTTASAAGFPCSASLPPLTPGIHTLEISSTRVENSVLESPRSGTLYVALVVPSPEPQYPIYPLPYSPNDIATVRRTAWTTGDTTVTADGIKMRLEVVADHLDAPVDLAFAPDGRLFIAERTGAIRVVRDGRVQPEPALSLAPSLGADGQLLALALDPQFEQTHRVFVAYTAPDRAGARMFHLVRLREAGDTLGDAVLLLDQVPASATPTAALRFGADGKLYAAFDANGDLRRATDPASLNGKVLRLNSDGTTPDDQDGLTPVFAAGLLAPTGIDWPPNSAAFWIADRGTPGASQLRAVGTARSSPAGLRRGVVGAGYALPAGTSPAGLAFYRGNLFPTLVNNLFVAAGAARHLLRIRLDAEKPGAVAPERLLQDQVGALQLVAIAPRGAIYFGTDTRIGRLVPAEH